MSVSLRGDGAELFSCTMRGKVPDFCPLPLGGHTTNTLWANLSTPSPWCSLGCLCGTYPTRPRTISQSVRQSDSQTVRQTGKGWKQATWRQRGEAESQGTPSGQRCAGWFRGNVLGGDGTCCLCLSARGTGEDRTFPPSSGPNPASLLGRGVGY